MNPAERPIVTDRAVEESEYYIRSPLEILYVLRAIRQRRALVAMYLPDSNDVLFTSIVHVDRESGDVVLDHPGNRELVQRALAAERLVCTTSHEQVKVQFNATGLRRVRHHGRDELACNVPAGLLRVQRRNAFRVRTPDDDPLKCAIRLPQGSRPPTAELVVLDLSCGGLAVIDHHPWVAMEPGAVYRNCSIDLPDVATVEFVMQVKDITPYTLQNGLTCQRAGCAFVDLPHTMGTLVQRYIVRVERDHAAKRSRFA
jgi:c-di-GMP-binding flagellar brake protein YcgR